MIDWSQVKAKTLWSYEDLTAKILEVLAFGFVQESCNHTMPEAQEFVQAIQEGYLRQDEASGSFGRISRSLEQLHLLGVRDYLDLVNKIETQTRCAQFLQETGFDFEDLIETLNFLFRWVLPFKAPLKEFIDPDSKLELSAFEILKSYRLRSNLDLLETCRTRALRRKLARETGVSETTLRTLAHRVDISRLAYVRGKTVKHLCGGGYNTLEKIAGADPEEMEAAMSKYYLSIGKTFSDFKAVIPLAWMIGGAGVLPPVLED